MALQLSLAVCDYDRTRALFDGRAEVEGCDITAVPLEPEEAFHRAFKFQEFDISEVSMSSYMMTTARGEAHYIAMSPRGEVFVADTLNWRVQKYVKK